MEKQFVTYEIALKLKELGFNKECFGTFFQGKFMSGNVDQHVWNLVHSKRTNSDCNSIDIVMAPLWQQAIEWFKDTHKIWINIDTSAIAFYSEPDDILLPPKFQFVIEDLEDRDSDYLFHSADIHLFFEEPYYAYEKAILKAIELINKK